MLAAITAKEAPQLSLESVSSLNRGVVMRTKTTKMKTATVSRQRQAQYTNFKDKVMIKQAKKKAERSRRLRARDAGKTCTTFAGVGGRSMKNRRQPLPTTTT